jgi:hypothetical protein
LFDLISQLVYLHHENVVPDSETRKPLLKNSEGCPRIEVHRCVWNPDDRVNVSNQLAVAAMVI